MKHIIASLFAACIAFAAYAQQSFITTPYLQIGSHPNPASMQLIWHATDSNDEWMVEYSNDGTAWKKTAVPAYHRVAVAGIDAHRVYHATLAGLIPGKKFMYRVNRNGQNVFNAEGQAIKNPDQPYRFVAFGDIGAETHDQRLLANRAFLSKPDFVVVPGDIVYEYGLISDYRKKFWPVYNAAKTDTSGVPLMRSVPFIAAVGNHDADSRDLDKSPDALAYFLYWDQPLNGPTGKEGGTLVPLLKGSDANRKAFLNAAGDTYPGMTNYSFDYGNAHWTVLDADTYVDWTDPELVNWVANDLAASKNAVWHFVMFHHPGFNSSREHYEQQQMRLLAPIFEAGHVDIVFNGHVHNYQRSYPLRFLPDKKGTLLVGGKDNKTVRGRVVNGKWTLDKQFDGKTKTNANGVIYVITGAGGQELYNPEQTNDPDSWQKFTSRFIADTHSLTVADVNGKTVKVRQVSGEGKELDAFVITKK
ncbi:MAG: metallophosphoesterase family protein [Chitinophagaceae bacterium]|nr:metallophosphoesterase family protein [Chitinophagaceae bacterium]